MTAKERVFEGLPVPVVAGVVWAGASLLVQRRGPGHGAGLLEFPGGKVEAGEQPRLALGRELREEWGPAAAALEVGRPLEVLRHVYPPPGLDVLLMFFEVRAPADEGWCQTLTPAAGASVVRLEPEALREDAFLEGDRPLARALREGAWRP